MGNAKVWAYSPKAQVVSGEMKSKIERMADNLITELKKQHLKGKPKKNDWNYIADIYYTWVGRRFYLCSKYNCPSPDALSPSFELTFARLEYTGNKYRDNNPFQLFFMRHTGQWVKLHEDISLNEAFKALKEDPWFTP
ncbi:hypothetical protein HZA99_02115 [Candidatus Woesearchaeota archaeon]|nr:hypothetical protein [Candidatus Woesearchaeota archaeon]